MLTYLPRFVRDGFRYGASDGSPTQKGIVLDAQVRGGGRAGGFEGLFFGDQFWE